MKDNIHLSIVTADGSAYDKMVGYVNLPTASGSLGMLPGHAAMLCALVEGTVKCSFEGGEDSIHVGAGVANANHDELTLIVSRAEVKAE